MTVHIDRPVWAANGLSAQDAYPHHPLDDMRTFRLLLLRTDGNRGGAALPTELVRSLRDWLSWWLGDHGVTPPPPGPDEIRRAIEVQRLALRERSGDQVSEDFRSGLAWADNALAEIERAARATGADS